MKDYLERNLIPLWIRMEKSIKPLYGDHLFKITLAGVKQERSDHIRSRFKHLKQRRYNKKVQFIYCKNMEQVYDVVNFCALEISDISGPMSEQQLKSARGNTHSIVKYIASDRAWFKKYIYRIEIRNFDSWYYQARGPVHENIMKFQQYLEKHLQDNHIEYKKKLDWFDSKYYLTEEDGDDFLFSAMLTHGETLKSNPHYLNIAKRVVE